MQLECLLENPIEPPFTEVNKCGVVCPKCTGEMKSYIMSAFRLGLSLFLADTFINHPSSTVTLQYLIKKLSVYHDVGRVVYKSARSVESQAGKLLNVTVLQLIESHLIYIEDTPDETYICWLVVENLSPAYLKGEIWDVLYLDGEPDALLEKELNC